MSNISENAVNPTVAPSNQVVKREFLSFVSLFLIGVTTVLGVLLINEKRNSVVNRDIQLANPTVQVAQKKYEKPALPAIREVISLPEPQITGSVSVEEAIQQRRSQRFYSQEAVTQAELSQILWSAQGETNEAGYRTAPSAKGAYPYSIYVVVRNVEGIAAGLYLYDSATHSLGSLGLANAGARLIEAGVQENAQKAPVVLALSAAFANMQEKFPDSDPHKNVYLEGGHIGQNVYLQVEALGMATVVTGGYNPLAVAEALEIDSETQEVVYLIPFGHVGESPVETEAE